MKKKKGNTNRSLLYLSLLVIASVLGLIFAASRQAKEEYTFLEGIVTNVDETMQIRNWDVEDPSWSPDGSQIAYVSDRDCQGELIGSGDIFIMDSDGTNGRNLTNNCLRNVEPRWSPDGRNVSFINSEHHSGYRQQISLVDTQTGNIQVIFNTDPDLKQYVRNTSWSPDGSQIAYSMQSDIHDEPLGIFVMNMDGSNSRLVVDDGFSVDWSVNDQFVYFSALGDPYDNDPEYRMFVANSDGSDVTMIPDIDGILPTWSPDGSKIAYRAHTGIETDNYGEIFIINIDGSEPIQLTNHEDRQEGFDWGVNGIIYYAKGVLYVLDYANEPSNAINEPGVLRARYPDGNTIYNVTPERNGPDSGILELIRDPVGDYGVLDGQWMRSPVSSGNKRGDAMLYDTDGLFAEIHRRQIDGITQISPGRFVYGVNEDLCIADFSELTETCYNVSFGGTQSRPHVSQGSVALDGRLIAFTNKWGSGIGLLDTQAGQYTTIWNNQDGWVSHVALSEDGTEMLVFSRTRETQSLYHYDLLNGDTELVDSNAQYGPMIYGSKSEYGIIYHNGWYNLFGSLAGLLPYPIGSGITTQLVDISEHRALFEDQISTVISFDLTDQGNMLILGFGVVVGDTEISATEECDEAICSVSFGFDIGPLTLWQCNVETGTCEAVLEDQEFGLSSGVLDPIELSGFGG